MASTPNTPSAPTTPNTTTAYYGSYSSEKRLYMIPRRPGGQRGTWCIILGIFMFAVIIIFMVNLSVSLTSRAREDVCARATVSSGRLQGTVVEVMNGSGVVAFYGVPYAENPSGERRFKKPNCLSAMEGVFDATYKRPPCRQPRFVLGPSFTIDNSNSTEDCLHLNIWIPTSCVSEGRNYSVVFFVHGGDYINGGNSYYFYDGRYLSSLGDVIVIVPNYRLGVFGFLNAEVPDAYGNMGIQDLALALRWVTDNCQYFGGNPNRVTLIGQGSGAAAVAALWSSPTMPQYQIWRVILMSGSNYAPLPENYGKKAEGNFQKFSKAAGCKRGQVEKKLQCLRSKSGSAILEAQAKARIRFTPSFYDQVSAEHPTDSMERYLDVQDKSVILSVTESEGDAFFYNMFGKIIRQKATITNETIEAVFSKRLGMPTEFVDLLISLSSYYPYSHSYRGWRDLIGDALFYCPVLRYAKMFHGLSVYSPAFLFMFAVKPSFSHTPGEYATHNDDVLMLFGVPFMFPHMATDMERSTSMRYIQTFTGFVKRTGVELSWPVYYSETTAHTKLTHSGLYWAPQKSCRALSLYYAKL
ncbi:acetylcholinesterase-1-like [Ornithodoros turicata]|uniref:acetylcholinesterase-1-like n=1 Tax=Ornithodoros turicata TaxID=34597 RepID=UPI003138C4F1